MTERIEEGFIATDYGRIGFRIVGDPARGAVCAEPSAALHTMAGRIGPARSAVT